MFLQAFNPTPVSVKYYVSKHGSFGFFHTRIWFGLFGVYEKWWHAGRQRDRQTNVLPNTNIIKPDSKVE